MTTCCKKMKWCAIGDSFTYLNDHLDETGGRLKKGYLTRVLDKLSELELINIGINGSTTETWVNQSVPEADIYTILLGTNDWHGGIPLGEAECFMNRTRGTILGNLGIIVDLIRAQSKTAPVIILNPVERADFIYLYDAENNAHGSYAMDGGQWLSDVAKGIYEHCQGENIYTVNLHDLCGFNQENVIKYKWVNTENGYQKLKYPDYVGIPFHPNVDEYPYPEETIALTYDGLHPSDEGCEILAGILAEKMKEILILE